MEVRFKLFDLVSFVLCYHRSVNHHPNLLVGAVLLILQI